MKSSLKAALLLLTLSFASACADNDPEAEDTKPPVITISSPASEESFKRGTEITFEAIVEDDQALATYNVSIHENDDDHSHGRKAASSFSFEKNYTVNGKTVTVSEKIAIPADATPGSYHFIVKAIDQAGNATGFADGTTKEVEIHITE